MVQNKEKKNRIIIITTAIVLGIVLCILLIVDMNNTVTKSLTVYQENQDILAEAMLRNAVAKTQKDGSNLIDNITLDINENFSTSSSMYCILSKNDKLVYLKDENTTSTLMDEKFSDYFNDNNIAARDNQKYIISTSEILNNGDNYTFVICTKQSYLEKKLNFDELRLHCLGYFVIYGVLLLIFIIYLFYKLRSKEKSIKAFEYEVKNDRLIIEKFEIDKNKNYVNSERDGVYSFYNRSIVDEVIACMSQEEKTKCIQIDIIIQNLKMEHFVLITAILGRIKEGGSVACYWADNQFKVLLFNADEKAVQGYIDLFISKYKSESEEKIEELKIVASRM